MLNMSEIPYSVRGGRRGVASLDALSDTTITNLQDADVLSYDVTSNQWINSASTGATAVPLGSASDVNITNVVDKQALVYNSASSEWINSNDLTATNINLGTTGTITTNLVSGFPGMLLESSGFGVAPNWVTNISVNSVQYLASRARTSATDDGLTPAIVYTNPSAATGGKFEISTKTVGDSLPTIKLTVNNAGAIGIGNSTSYYDPVTFAYAGPGPSYGAHGAILQSRGYDEEPKWLPKGTPGQVLTASSQPNTDLIWTTIPSSATEYLYLEKTSGAAPISNAYQVIGDTNNPLQTLSQNQSWFGGFASNGSFTFTVGGAYRLRTEVLVVKTSAVPGGQGFWIGVNENSTTPNTANLIKLHYVNFKSSLPGSNCVLSSYTIPMEYILRPTVGTPYLLYAYGGGASFYVQGGGLGICSVYIEKIA